MGTESAASQNHKQPLSASPALMTGQQASPLASSSSFVFYRVQKKIKLLPQVASQNMSVLA